MLVKVMPPSGRVPCFYPVDQSGQRPGKIQGRKNNSTSMIEGGKESEKER